MNHRWENNVCVKCGLHRKRKTRTLLMAITNHPPYNHYKHEYLWLYWKDGDKNGVWERPECNVVNLSQVVRAYLKDLDKPERKIYHYLDTKLWEEKESLIPISATITIKNDNNA